MGLSIENNSIYTTLSIPFASMDDAQWNDNTWLVEHLRQLADYIEENKPHIYKIGLESDHQYKIPYLNIVTFKK